MCLLATLSFFFLQESHLLYEGKVDSYFNRVFLLFYSFDSPDFVTSAKFAMAPLNSDEYLASAGWKLIDRKTNYNRKTTQ